MVGLSRVRHGDNLEGGKGLLDLGLFKRDLRNHFLTDVLGTLGLDLDTKQMISDTMKDVGTYRAKCGFPGAASGDRAWMGLLSHTAKKFFSIMEEVVHGIAYDTTLKLALKSSKTVTEALEDGHLQTAMTELKKIAKEIVPARGPQTVNRLIPGEHDLADHDIADQAIAGQCHSRPSVDRRPWIRLSDLGIAPDGAFGWVISIFRIWGVGFRFFGFGGWPRYSDPIGGKTFSAKQRRCNA